MGLTSMKQNASKTPKNQVVRVGSIDIPVLATHGLLQPSQEMNCSKSNRNAAPCNADVVRAMDAGK